MMNNYLFCKKEKSKNKAIDNDITCQKTCMTAPEFGKAKGKHIA